MMSSQTLSKKYQKPNQERGRSAERKMRLSLKINVFIPKRTILENLEDPIVQRHHSVFHPICQVSHRELHSTLKKGCEVNKWNLLQKQFQPVQTLKQGWDLPKVPYWILISPSTHCGLTMDSRNIYGHGPVCHWQSRWWIMAERVFSCHHCIEPMNLWKAFPV
jgi:hypothetical protein